MTGRLEGKIALIVGAGSAGCIVTNQIINIAKQGDIHVLLVHDEKSELNFLQNGFGIKRSKLMYNDYIIVGPKEDPAEIKNKKDFKEVFKKFLESKIIFVSRSDLSGTNVRELKLWNDAGVDIKLLGKRYKEIGSGMGATLNFTNEIKGYTLVDRATWLSSKNVNQLQLLFEDQKRLLNQYSLILVKPKNSNEKNIKLGEILIEWLLSNTVQKLINDYKINDEQVYFFNGDN